MNIDNMFNKILPSFSLFNCEFSPENRLIDIFPNCFSFHSLNRKSEDNIKSYLHDLENISLQSSSNPHIVIVILDTSIKNHITTSIAHVYIHNSPIIKTIHYAANVMSTEAKIFAIRCGINQAIHLSNIKQIIVIINSI